MDECTDDLDEPLLESGGSVKREDEPLPLSPPSSMEMDGSPRLFHEGRMLLSNPLPCGVVGGGGMASAEMAPSSPTSSA